MTYYHRGEIPVLNISEQSNSYVPIKWSIVAVFSLWLRTETTKLDVSVFLQFILVSHSPWGRYPVTVKLI